MRKKLLTLFVATMCAVMAQSQISWPPKSLPCKVPFILTEEIEYDWGIKSIVNKLPLFIPGRLHGQPVRMKCVVPNNI